MSEFRIGVSQLEGQKTYTRKNWFSIKDGDNLFRIIPPVHSGADRGVWAKYYAVHKGFKSADGKMRPFICPMKKNKDRIIEIGCPICDIYGEREAQVATLSAQGTDQEKITQFRYEHVMPYQVEKKFYLNVLNAEGKIGILSIPSSAFYELDKLLKQLKSVDGIDATGVQKGLYINFKRSGVKPRVNFHVEVAYEGKTLMSQGTPKFHDLTPELIERLRTETVDLLKMYKDVTPEQISRIAAASPDERAKLLDIVFGVGEKEEGVSKSDALLETHVPSYGATMVGRVNVTEKGLTVDMPTPRGTETTNVTQKNAVAAANSLSDAQFAQLVGANRDTVQKVSQAPKAETKVASTGVSNLGGGVAELSNDDFLKMFGSKK